MVETSSQPAASPYPDGFNPYQSPYPPDDPKSLAIAAAAAQYQQATGMPYPGEADPYAVAAAQQAAQIQAQGAPVDGGRAEPSKYPQLEQTLSTVEGFKQSILYTGLANRILLIVLGIAGVALAYNIIDTVRSLLKQNLPFNTHFLPMFFTVRDTTGAINIGFLLEVWLPVIAIPVVLIIMLIAALTRGASTAKLFPDYQRGGFVVELVRTGLKVVSTGSSSNSMLGSVINMASGDSGGSGSVMIFGRPSIPMDTVLAAARHINTASSDRGYGKEIATFMGRTGTFGKSAILARLADSSLADGLYITAQSSDTAPQVRVAVPDEKNPGALKLFKLKKTIPLI